MSKDSKRSLKNVIFSHVPESQRLQQASLDDLVQFRAGEKQKRIDSLLKELREINRVRAHLESQADQTARRELVEKIKRREIEIEVLPGSSGYYLLAGNWVGRSGGPIYRREARAGAQSTPPCSFTSHTSALGGRRGG